MGMYYAWHWNLGCFQFEGPTALGRGDAVVIRTKYIDGKPLTLAMDVAESIRRSKARRNPAGGEEDSEEEDSEEDLDSDV